MRRVQALPSASGSMSEAYGVARAELVALEAMEPEDQRLAELPHPAWKATAISL